jgi:hypothetical protein
MKTRMMCTDCLRTAEAETLLEGSDTIELLAWCCFALPGLLYCWWRHALRIKICAFCGGRELVREARAAAARQPQAAPSRWEARVHSAPARFDWPGAFANPRDRLRHGSVIALLAGTFVASLAPAALDPAGGGISLLIAHAAAAASVAWGAYQGLRTAQRRSDLSDCRAWDAHGRSIRIERVL